MANLAKTIQKLGVLKIWSTTFGSKMQPRGIRSSKILASWPADDGQVFGTFFCCLLGQYATILNILLSWGMNMPGIILLA